MHITNDIIKFPSYCLCSSNVIRTLASVERWKRAVLRLFLRTGRLFFSVVDTLTSLNSIEIASRHLSGRAGRLISSGRNGDSANRSHASWINMLDTLAPLPSRPTHRPTNRPNPLSVTLRRPVAVYRVMSCRMHHADNTSLFWCHVLNHKASWNAGGIADSAPRNASRIRFWNRKSPPASGRL